MQRWLERILDVPVAEQRRTALVLAYIFFAASACVVGRTVADTLFLARIGADQLAWMYLVYALVVAAAAVAYTRLARGLSLRVLVAATHLTLACPPTGANRPLTGMPGLVGGLRLAQRGACAVGAMHGLGHPARASDGGSSRVTAPKRIFLG